MSTIARMTLAEYERMAENGPSSEASQRTELLRGELRTMNPIGVPHAEIVDRLTDWSHSTLPRERIRVRIQQPLRIAEFESEPLPDVTWVTQRRYGTKHPGPEDVLLLIEVADSTLASDRGEKGALYAEAGIDDYWIVNIPDQCVEVRREPLNGKYQSVEVFRAGETVQSLRQPDARLAVDFLFPRDER